MADRLAAAQPFPTPATGTQRARRPGRIQLVVSPNMSPVRDRVPSVSPDMEAPSQGLMEVQCKMRVLDREEHSADRHPDRHLDQHLKKKLDFDTEQQGGPGHTA